jgi:cell division protein FtsW (lipid II flippase)
VTSLVALAGVVLTYAGQTSHFDTTRNDLAAGRLVNLAAVEDAPDIAPLLRTFEEPEREVVASATYRALTQPDSRPLTHVGGLAALSLPAGDISADDRLLVLNERLRNRPGAAAVPLFTSADIAAIKPAVVVRTPEAFLRQIVMAGAVFMIAFWLSHAARWLLGTIGDPVLLPATQLLSGTGLAAMIALRDPLRDTMPAVPFAAGVAAGVAIFTAVSLLDFEDPRLRRAVLLPLTVATLLATALLVFGSGPAGSGARVNLLGAQPVEAIRLLVVFGIAAYFARRWQFLREFSTSIVAGRGTLPLLQLPRWKDVRPLIVTLSVLLAFFFLQRDLGPALVMACLFLGLYGIARARPGLVACGFAALAAAFAGAYLIGVPSTVTRRVAIWLDPWENGLTGGDQIAHALWAFSTGAHTGVGPGMGDPQMIPAGHTDLVIAAIGEELGFVGVFVMAGLFALLVWRMLRIALRAPGDYTALLATGLCLTIAVQVLVIAAGVLGLLPLAGIVTPFLSYGRSAMLSNFAAVGICCAIARRPGPVREPFLRPIRATGWLLTTAGVLVVGWAFTVQVAHADAFAVRGSLARQADGEYRYQYNPRLAVAAREIVRGTIYDRTGLPIATSRPEELLPFADDFRDMGLPSGCDGDGMPGGAAARCYPLGGLAFHVLGDSESQTNWAASNTSFVERELDARLRGFDDNPRRIEIRDLQGHGRPVVGREYDVLLPLVRHRANPNARDVRRLMDADRHVRVTLDARLQVRVARALQAHADAHAGRGAAVVIDARTGELLASVSYPWPERRGSRGRSALSLDHTRLLDRARYGLYPPGSTFKLVTAAAAFRENPAAAQSSFLCVRLDGDRVGGHVHGERRPIRDDPLVHTPHGRLDLRGALVMSCNAYFAQLAQRVGWQALAETASAAHVAAASPPLDRNLPATLAHAGYGQGEVLASPLRMARIAAAVANGGVLRDVRLTLEPPGPELGQVQWITERAAEQLAAWLREAVTTGTGRALARHPGAIAGKTGTAEVDGQASHSWFIGFAPARGRGRTIAFAVVLENAGYGGRVAAALAGDIVSAAEVLP